MRLLKHKDDGEFSLVEFIGNKIPPYAILSHTWGADGEEVTFRDLMKCTGKGKAGYQKIRFCREQAATDGLQYFWVDTCCIDKSSSTELSEAINSMFRWYHDAVKCYVYLSDVSINNSIKNDHFFQKSRWFTRGWTLQELIAPASVEFFSTEGERLGDKKSLERQIHEITGITTQALQGGLLSQFSINERMSWAAKRETKREEDAVYSLLGIFDIYMPLIYGEGRKRALVRLYREIKDSLENQSPTQPLALFSKSKDVSKGQEADDASWIVPFEQNPRFTGREFPLAKHEEALLVRDLTSSGAGGKHALVQYDYARNEDNEIDLFLGEYVTDIDQIDESWWAGINSKGEFGLFPSNYVELVEDGEQLPRQRARRTAVPVASAVEPRSEPEPAPLSLKSAGSTATALFDYEAAEDNELSFAEGDKITRIEFIDNDWWFGVGTDGRPGLFPSNYVHFDK